MANYQKTYLRFLIEIQF